jgi:hypothetical protein
MQQAESHRSVLVTSESGLPTNGEATAGSMEEKHMVMTDAFRNCFRYLSRWGIATVRLLRCRSRACRRAASYNLAQARLPSAGLT